MKDAYYFSHDSNAHKDPKTLKLRARFGWEGYGIFWAIIETLREQEGYGWKSDDKELLSYSFANGEPIVNQVIDYCIEIGLLTESDDGYIQSDSLKKRMDIKEEKRQKKVEAGKKGAHSRWKNGGANGSANSNGMAEDGKGKEKKVKESKEKESKEEKTIREIKDLRAAYSSDLIQLIDRYWSVIKKTRKTNTISYNVILQTMKKWAKYDHIVIKYALKKHIDAYDDGDKKENYTLAIMRNTSPENARDELDKKVTQLKSWKQKGVRGFETYQPNDGTKYEYGF
jgi:hypothetical protein